MTILTIITLDPHKNIQIHQNLFLIVMTDIVFKLIPAYDKLIAYILGKKDKGTEQEKQKDIADKFKKKWNSIKGKILREIASYSGPFTIQNRMLYIHYMS
ncbi:MAG: hypothetical protein DRJ64_04405 [Thermoprotei archaeon]|nr:MAG: hypothetical protein B6U94_03485 [Thermofilum sp. ex4484_79]RLF06515.1 MAG: hypothetical protein DRJ64_04405 [Thermoprotei archaeon]